MIRTPLGPTALWLYKAVTVVVVHLVVVAIGMVVYDVAHISDRAVPKLLFLSVFAIALVVLPYKAARQAVNYD